MLGGLFLLFVLENALGLVRHRGLRPVSDTLFFSSCQTVLEARREGQHVLLVLGQLHWTCPPPSGEGPLGVDLGLLAKWLVVCSSYQH